MRLFSDTIVNRVDAKGRVSVPARFRQYLAAQSADSLFIIKSFVHRALEGCGPDLMDEFMARLAPLDPFSDEYDAFADTLFGASVELPWDSEGRIRLPDDYLAHANLADRVAFVGLGRKFQIWNPDDLVANRKRNSELARNTRGLLAQPQTVGAGPKGGAR